MCRSCDCACHSEAHFGHHGRRHGYGPLPWTGYCWPHGEPTKAERKESLEAFKKHLEGRLAEVADELGKL